MTSLKLQCKTNSNKQNCLMVAGPTGSNKETPQRSSSVVLLNIKLLTSTNAASCPTDVNILSWLNFVRGWTHITVKLLENVQYSNIIISAKSLVGQFADQQNWLWYYGPSINKPRFSDFNLQNQMLKTCYNFLCMSLKASLRWCLWL